MDAGQRESHISTHTPHARRDVVRPAYCHPHGVFQLTRLMRGVTRSAVIGFYLANISTHTPHARRDAITMFFYMILCEISTHTPHARRDHPSQMYNKYFPISTHTPHARRDYSVQRLRTDHHRFQLTRLMRGVTTRHKCIINIFQFQLTRLMRGVTFLVLIMLPS